MITNIENVNGQIVWKSKSGNHLLDDAGGTYISSDNAILFLSKDRSELVAIDENGNVICKLNNSDNLYLMYLQKHPRFGLSVVASVKDENNNWSDKYISLVGDEFKVMSVSR